MSHRYAGAALALSLLAASAEAQPSAPAFSSPALSSSNPAQAPLIGREAVKAAIDLHDKQDFAAAIATYLRVPASDSAYATAQAELALSYWSNKQYPEAAAAARRAIDLGMKSPMPYVALANSQEDLGQLDKCLETFSQGLKLYPRYSMLWYNQAVTLGNQPNQTAAAVASYQRSLELRPMHPNSHLQLGRMEILQGHPAHGLLGLLGYLLYEPDGPGSNEVLSLAEQLSTGSLEVGEKDKRKPTSPNDAFAELDQLLTARVALRKDYRSAVKFPAAVVKQTQLLVEKFPLATDAASADFWQRAYGPMVEVLRQGDNLTTFTYFILSSANDKAAAKWVKGNSAKVKKLMEALNPKLMTLRDFQTVERNDKPTRVEAWFYSSGNISGLGDARRDATGKIFYEGEWQHFDEEGNLMGEGSYRNGEKTGLWRLYHESGKLARESSYNEQGQLNGPYREYHDNGQRSVDATYRNDKLAGVVKIYHPCGALKEERIYGDGGLAEGSFTKYYANGQAEVRGTYRRDETDGAVTNFYADGTVETELTMAAGKEHGPFTSYWAGPGKRVETRGTMDQGQVHGAYTNYHPNGQVRETGTFTRGKRTGVWRSFYADGKPSEERTYDNEGRQHGPYRDYDVDGVVFNERTYERDQLRKSVYLDKAGKAVQQNNIGAKTSEARGLRPDGSPLYTGSYRAGLLNGEWSYVYRHGTVSEKRRWRDDKLDGVQEEFHPNGKLKSRVSYENGEKHGRYERYASDGVLRQDGWYVRGQEHGIWHDYYPDGRLSDEYGYHRGDQNGQRRSYTVTGKLWSEMALSAGRPTHLVEYDSAGRQLINVALKPDAASYVLPYPSGKPRLRMNLTCGLYAGSEWYYPSGKASSTVPMNMGGREGLAKAYHANGKLASEGAYVRNQQVGEWKYYTAEGKLRSKGRYEQGGQDGEWTWYGPNGQMTRLETYREGVLHGPSRRYDDNGQLIYEKNYVSGDIMAWRHLQPNGQSGAWQDLSSQHGTVRSYFANGKVSAEETYKNGVLDGKSRLYHSNGQLYRETEVRDGVTTGPQRTYTAEGKLREEENYLHDEQHGRSRYYRPDGTLEREESWRNGEQYGPTVHYNAQGKPERTETYWNNNLYDAK